MNNNKIAELSMQKLLCGEDRYEIPLYQRNYAWGRREIEQLVRDVIDYIPKDPNDNKDQNYYIGTLVVFGQEDGVTYEVIDGQQRLTTLVLLVAYLKHSGELAEYLKEQRIAWEWLGNFEQNRPIHFQSRDDYKKALKRIFSKEKINKEVNTEETEVSTEILGGYGHVKDIFLEGVLSEKKQTLEKFCKFLLENVKIMRVQIPQDTDRHHYFEIMNNRGEQLEKHEILKSRMIAALHDEKSQSCFGIVWDACANMGNYVQIGFSEEQRNAVFGENWESFYVKDFEELQEKINPRISNDSNKRKYPTLSEIIDDNKNFDINISPESEPEFKSIIDFPNFLLHVLRVHVLRVQKELDISLNDNQLIREFEAYMLKDVDEKEKEGKIKNFIYNLLLCKFLYDQYIIRIKPGSIDEMGKSSLQRLLKKQNDDGNNVSGVKYDDTFGVNSKRIIMLLSSLHVSATGSKHWLDAALNHLVDQWKKKQNIEAGNYLKRMEDVATSFVFDRSLSPNSDLDYFSIIYENKGECQARKDISQKTGDIKKYMDARLVYRTKNGAGIPHRIFHFLDYLLWLKYKKKFPEVENFVFTTSNNSVEHYYPQYPISGDSLPSEKLHSFGNLCLINSGKNSKLSNYMPNAKKEHYEKSDTIDSIKQHLMMKYKTWNEDRINAHDEEMKDLLLRWLETGTVETENS